MLRQELASLRSQVASAPQQVRAMVARTVREVLVLQENRRRQLAKRLTEQWHINSSNAQVIAALRREVQELRATATQLQQHVESLSRDKALLTSALQDSRVALDAMLQLGKHHRLQLRTELQLLASEVAAMPEMVAANNATILQRFSSEWRNRDRCYQGQQNALRTQVEELRQALDCARELAERREAELARVRLESQQRLDQESESHRQQLAEVEAELDQVRLESQERLDQESESHKHQLAEVEAELARVRLERQQRLDQESESHRQQLAEMEAELDQVRLESQQRLDQESKSHRQQLAEVEAELDQVRVESQQRLDQESKSRERLVQQVQASCEIIEAKERQTELLEEQVATLTEQLQQMERCVEDSSNARQQALEAQVAQLQRSLAEFKVRQRALVSVT